MAGLSGRVWPFRPGVLSSRAITPARNIAGGYSGWWPLFPNWPTSRPRWRSWPGAASVGLLAGDGATWRACAPTCGLSVPLWLSSARPHAAFCFPCSHTVPRRGVKESPHGQSRRIGRGVERPRGKMALRHDVKLRRTRGGLTSHAYFLPRARLRIKCNYNLPPFSETVAISPVELAF
jgi:hypothetical protein